MVNHISISCTSCGKVLAKKTIEKGIFEIKCKRCGTINTLLKESRDQVIITDKDGVILFANNVTQEVTGFSLEEMIGKKPSLWGGLMPKLFFESLWREIKEKKKSVIVRIENKKKDGTHYWAHLRISPVFEVHGDIKYFIGIETVID